MLAGTGSFLWKKEEEKTNLGKFFGMFKPQQA